MVVPPLLKRFFVCAALCFTLTLVYASSNLGKTDNAATLPRVLPKNSTRNISGVIPAENNTFLVITAEEYAPPFEECICVLTCDPSGRILDANESIITNLSFLGCSSDSNMPLVWLGSSNWMDPTELWLAKRDGTKFQRRLLLKPGKSDPLLRKCWLFEVYGKKKIFVEEYELKQLRTKGELDWVPIHWLYCYRFENGEFKLDTKALVAEGKTESDVECALVGNDVYVWVCEEGGMFSSGILRVAKWQRDGQLDWTECYRGKKGYLLGGLTVDTSHGSAAAIFPLTKGQWVPSAVICQIQDGSPRSVNLEIPFPGRRQLLRVNWDGVDWLLTGHDRWGILMLNRQLETAGEIHHKLSYTSDYYLVRSINEKVYITTIMPDGQLKIAEIERFAGAKSTLEQVGRRDFKELSKETIDIAYKEYIKGDGKHLLKATDVELEGDIASGNRVSISSLVSYYRLFLRDEKQAKKCLSEQIKSIVKEGVGKEHWITEVQLTFYGEPAIKPLLEIAGSGTPEERRIAVETLSLFPDIAVTSELVKLLDKSDVRRDSITALAICEAGITASNPEAVDFLIKASTGKFMRNGEVEPELLVLKSRQLLMKTTSEYKDKPEDWSEEKWDGWWKKHRGSFKFESESASEFVQEQKEFKRRHVLFQELAKMLEKNLDN